MAATSDRTLAALGRRRAEPASATVQCQIPDVGIRVLHEALRRRYRWMGLVTDDNGAPDPPERAAMISARMLMAVSCTE